MAHQLAGPDIGTVIPLIGRDDDLARVQGLLAQPGTRLVTITGVGGVGKTALAMDLARQAGTTGSHRAVVTELAPVSDPALVLPAIARAAGLSLATDGDLAARLQLHLDQEPTLLVLDNLEHLDVAPIVAQVLAETTRVTILATSRTRLRLSREREYRLAPLPVPDLAERAAKLATNPAAMLLVERIRESQPSFTITAANASAIRSLSQHLEGIPLAIELAASHGRVFSVAELLHQFETRQDLLRGGAVDQPDRQRTMEASIQWSLDLLPPDARDRFGQLCVFPGAFSASDAAAVAGLDGPAIEHLAEHGLITVLADPDEPRRFRILVPIREFGLRREPDLSGPYARLAGVIGDLCEQAAPWRSPADVDQAVALLHRYVDDALAVCAFHLEHAGAQAIAAIAATFQGIWGTVCDPQTARLTLGRLMDAIGPDIDAVDPIDLARARYAQGTASYRCGLLEESAAILEDALVLARASGSAELVARTNHNLLTVLRGLKRIDRIDELIDEASTSALATGNRWLIWRAHYEASAHALYHHDLDRAEAAATQALDMARGGIREAYLLGVSLSLLGHIHTFRAEYPSARENYHRTIALLTAPDANESLYAAKQALARLELRCGDDAAAIPILTDCLERHARHENPTWIRAGLVDSAWLAHLLDDDLRAARLFGAAGVSGSPDLDFLVADAVAPVLLAVRERLGERDERTHHRIGQATPRDDVIRETLEWLESIAAQNDPLAGANDPILTQREREVLARMAQGESNRQIAAALYIGSATVDTHAKRILRKLGTQSRAGAVAAGIRQGLIDPPDA